MAKKKEKKKVLVKYISQDGYPHSIDSGTQGFPCSFEVDEGQIFVRNGKKYYRLTTRFGTTVDLRVI